MTTTQKNLIAGAVRNLKEVEAREFPTSAGMCQAVKNLRDHDGSTTWTRTNKLAWSATTRKAAAVHGVTLPEAG